MNEQNWLPYVIERKPCAKHDVPRGLPCYEIFGIKGNVTPAICNGRARRAGMTGRIDPKSLSKSR